MYGSSLTCTGTTGWRSNKHQQHKARQTAFFEAPDGRKENAGRKGAKLNALRSSLESFCRRRPRNKSQSAQRCFSSVIPRVVVEQNPREKRRSPLSRCSLSLDLSLFFSPSPRRYDSLSLCSTGQMRSSGPRGGREGGDVVGFQHGGVTKTGRFFFI